MDVKEKVMKMVDESFVPKNSLYKVSEASTFRELGKLREYAKGWQLELSSLLLDIEDEFDIEFSYEGVPFPFVENLAKGTVQDLIDLVQEKVNQKEG